MYKQNNKLNGFDYHIKKLNLKQKTSGTIKFSPTTGNPISIIITMIFYYYLSDLSKKTG